MSDNRVHAVPQRWTTRVANFFRRYPSALLGLILLPLLFLTQWPTLVRMFPGHAAEAPAGLLQWRTDLSQGLQEAAKTNKPVLAVFSANWCPSCQQMKQKVWPDAEVGRLANQGYIPVYLDVDRSDNASWVQRYGIQTIPTVLVLDGAGSPQQGVNVLNRDEMIVFLQQASPLLRRGEQVVQ